MTIRYWVTYCGQNNFGNKIPFFIIEKKNGIDSALWCHFMHKMTVQFAKLKTVCEFLDIFVFDYASVELPNSFPIWHNGFITILKPYCNYLNST